MPTPVVDYFFLNGDELKSPLNVSVFGASNTITIEGTGFVPADIHFALSSPDVRLYDFQITPDAAQNQGVAEVVRVHGTFKAKGLRLFSWWTYRIQIAVYNVGGRFEQVVPT